MAGCYQLVTVRGGPRTGQQCTAYAALLLLAQPVCLRLSPLQQKVASVYEVSLPPDVNSFLEQFSGWLTLGIQGVATSGISCFGLDGYFYQLLFWMALPVALVVLVIVGVAISSLLKRRKKTVIVSSRGKDEAHAGAFHLADVKEDEREPSFFEKCLPAVLTLLFFLCA